MLLGRYLGVEPAELDLTYGPLGKPGLRDADGRSVSFSLSWSASLALFALSSGGQVGIDVEQIRPGIAIDQIAAQFFSVQEIEALRRTPAATRTNSFLKLWTRKEAFGKALGTGVEEVCRNFWDSRNGRISVVADATTWTVQSLVPRRGFIGAVAAAGRNWTTVVRGFKV